MTVGISGVPRTPVGSLRRALEPTINITETSQARTEISISSRVSSAGRPPTNPRDHLSRHLGGDRAGPGGLITAGGPGRVGIIRPVEWPRLRPVVPYFRRPRRRHPGSICFLVVGAAYGRPRRSPEDDDDVYLRPETTTDGRPPPTRAVPPCNVMVVTLCDRRWDVAATVNKYQLTPMDPRDAA